jgi:chemotaxis protein methyltransferase CheR
MLDQTKAYLLEARLLPVVRQRNLPDLATLADRLRTGRDTVLEQDVLNAMMTHETSFFRDKSPFETLKLLIPTLVKQRAVARHLVIWSAASSSGQEVYSLAMLLQEHFRDLLAGWKIRLIATDFSEPVLARAREGVYSELEISRGLSPELRAKYFTPLQGRWSIVQDCRRGVEFRQINLTGAWPAMPPCDIIFLRNVMIYFDVPTRAAILAKMHGAVRSDGALFLGGAETMLGVTDTWQRLEGSGCSYYRPKPLPKR